MYIYGNTTTETSGGIYFLGKTSVYNSSIVNNEIRDQWNSAYVIRVADNIKMYNLLTEKYSANDNLHQSELQTMVRYYH